MRIMLRCLALLGVLAFTAAGADAPFIGDAHINQNGTLVFSVDYQTISVVQSGTTNVTAVGITPGTRIVSTRIPLAIAGMKVAPKEQRLVKNQSANEEAIL